VRREHSEIWLAFNTGLADDPVYEKFVSSPPDSAIVVKTSYADNPWFPAVLDAERRYLERVDPDSHANIWLGNCRAYSDAVIFKGKYVVEDFTPQETWSGPYHGCDFGFSDDPCAAVRCYVDGPTLYISHEFWGLHVELDQLAAAIERAIPGARQHRLLCDCSRPESISYLAHHGHPNAMAAPKWPGSVLDGIAFLRAFERIVVHPRCTHMLDELRTYSFKIDKLTGQPLTEPEDKGNHLADSLRYSLSELIQGRGAGWLSYYSDLANTNAAPAALPSAWAPAAPTMEQRLRSGGATATDLTAWHSK
jgi:phage terminase large subunit